MDTMRLIFICLFSMMLAGVLVCAEAGAEVQAPASREALQTFGVQDLRVIRDLDTQVKQGDISEPERAQLWQAYLARLSAERCRDGERPAQKRKSSLFTGPGL